MNVLLRRSLQFFSQRRQEVELPDPFSQTVNPQNFRFVDARFIPSAFHRQLNENQVQHCSTLLSEISLLLEGQQMPSAHLKQYIHPQLLARVSELKQIIKNQFKLQPNFKTMQQIKGYLEVKTEPEEFNMFDTHYFHKYKMTRTQDILKIALRKEATSTDQAQILKKDIESLKDRSSDSQQFKSFKKEVEKQAIKPPSFKERIFAMKSSLFGSGSSVSAKKQKYLTIEEIHCQAEISLKGRKYTSLLISKWLYRVDGLEPETLRNNRKRILFDLQHWNRGTFFQVMDFTQPDRSQQVKSAESTP